MELLVVFATLRFYMGRPCIGRTDHSSLLFYVSLQNRSLGVCFTGFMEKKLIDGEKN